MNDRTNRHAFLRRLLDTDESGPPPKDDLDGLLRTWHREHADAAVAARDRILGAVAADAGSTGHGVLARIGGVAAAAARSRILRLAAVIAIAAGLVIAFVNTPANQATADVIAVADAGELTAFAADGERLGPCPLQHTDVDAEISGPVTRVTVRQRYANPYPLPIEAVYVFPLSHRSAIDAMRIVVRGPSGERIIEGEVKERSLARHIYEAAKASGSVASLLEQERPNIFTQSVANIEPGSTITVEISYVEWLPRRDGTYAFVFPMTVGPRYIPGSRASGGPAQLPDGLTARPGIVLLGPASATIASATPPMSPNALDALLAGARAIRTPTPEWYERSGGLASGVDFTVRYANGSQEVGRLLADGTGHLNGRGFYVGPAALGGGFAADTSQVPDASRITPMPVPPPQRAGHDVSMRVSIDAGGRPVRELKSDLHEVVTSDRDGRTYVELKSQTAIPNRDFSLSWRVDGDDVHEGVLAHRRSGDDKGFVAIVLDPPSRARPSSIAPRELVFVLDVSGSMSGFPIEQSKALMAKAIDAMRPEDTFNVITFAGQTGALWPEPRPATEESRREARAFVESRQGGGGTEMMKAIEAALKPASRADRLTPKALADLPADGRRVRVALPLLDLDESAGALHFDGGRHGGRTIRVRLATSLPTVIDRAGREIELVGSWKTSGGDRLFDVEQASFLRADARPARFVVFLTDGLVGNDQAIVQAIRDHAQSTNTTRVFALGIGNSVNRFLIEEMAREGRGTSEIVLLAADAGAAVERLERRMRTPVLLDIEARFDGLEVTDVMPDPRRLPDLHDEEPIVLVGRYAHAGSGTITLRGRTGEGPWERTLSVELPQASDRNASLPSLWARAKIDEAMAPHRAAIEAGSAPPEVRAAIVELGERYRIVSPFTSFVAVERRPVVVQGTPMLIRVPIELPEGTSWRGFFGEADRSGGKAGEQLFFLGVQAAPAVRLVDPMSSGGERGERKESLRDLREAPGAPAEPGTSGGFGGGGTGFGRRASSPPAPPSPPSRGRADEMTLADAPNDLGAATGKRTPAGSIAPPGVGRRNATEAESQTAAPPSPTAKDELVDRAREVGRVFTDQERALLARRLDSRLLGLVPELDRDAAPPQSGPAPQLRVDKEGRIGVVMVLETNDDRFRAGLAWLESRGIPIETQDPAVGLVVAWVAPSELAALVLEGPARRIEPLAPAPGR